jgi:predicted nucleic acid-binding protein
VARRGAVGGTLVLDSEVLSKLARGDEAARTWARRAHERDAAVVTVASVLAEVLRGGQRDAAVHRVLSRVAVLPVDRDCGRIAGELLGATGLPGRRCAMDALVAAVALSQPRPVVLLTSDPGDLGKLTEEADRPRSERVAVVRI